MPELLLLAAVWLFIILAILLIAAANVQYSDRVVAMTPVELADHEAEMARFFHER